MKCDILIASLPVSTLNHAPAAPALLKACVEKVGLTARTADLSQSFLLNQSHGSFESYDKDTQALQPNIDCHGMDLTKVNDWVLSSIEKIKEIDPEYIGLSIFSYYMHRSAYLLSKALREACPEIKIIIGGFGATQPASSLVGLVELRKIESVMNFNDFMKKKGLCDHYILGEGEDALVGFLLGENHAARKPEDEKLYDVPNSDFSDYDLLNYQYASKMLLPITGSKGCVRKCTFCDVPAKYGRFRYRTGKDIASEILELKEEHGVSDFAFTDSLINGSLSALEEMTIELADYNRRNPDDLIRWSGHYISRPKGQTPERIYQLMAESGAQGLAIGLESGSNRVLDAMLKKVKIEDVDWEMEIFDRYRISTVMLIMFGFYNETEEDFQETLDTIIRYQKYAATGTLIRMELGHPLGITSETPLYTNQHALGIEINENNPLLWTAKDNPGLDFRERVRRRLVAQVVCDKLGIPTGLTSNQMRMMLITAQEIYGKATG